MLPRDRGRARRADDGFRSLIVIDEQPQARVLVAMGGQGALVRTPDGEWGRYAVLDRKPFSQHGPSWLGEMYFAPLVALLLSPLVYAVAWRRAGKLRAFALAGSTALVQLVVCGILLLMVFADVDYIIYGTFTLVAVVISLTTSFSIAFAVRPRPTVLTTLRPPPPPSPLS